MRQERGIGQAHGHGLGAAPERGHGHGHGSHRGQGLRHVLKPHGHDAADQLDDDLTASRLGMRTLWLSFGVLLLTAVGQAAVVALSGSVALLADTVHNIGDALSAVPLAIAFALGRRAATRRFTYGYGRLEDLAGLVIVALIAGSAVLVAVESADRLLHPQRVDALPVVAVAAVLGFVGNELVARWRIRVGRSIGSAALVADGLHARADGFTSLGVLLAAGGTALGWRWTDPVVGLLVAGAIGVVLLGAAKQVLGRLLDVSDPGEVDRVHRLAAGLDEVRAVQDVRLRWSGHGQLAELTVVVDRGSSLVEAHRVAHEVERALRAGIPRLLRAHVHAHPASDAGPEAGSDAGSAAANAPDVVNRHEPHRSEC